MSHTFQNQETSARFAPETLNGRAWAYSNGGPLHVSSDAPTTLTVALQRTAANFPTHGVRYVQADGSEDFQSYPDLLQEARRVLTGLRSNGLKAGDRVILQCERLRDHFTAFWGCVLGGITPVTVAVAPSYEEKNGIVNKLFNIWKLLDEPALITNRHLQAALSNLPRVAGMNGMQLLEVESLRASEPAEQIHEAKPSDLVFFQLTSGSTGVPKCIQEIHSAIIAHVHGSQQFNNYTSDDVIMSWLPVDHVVPILTMHLKDVYLGCNEIQCKSDFVLSEPLRWLDLMEKHHVTHTWAPNFAFKLIADRLKSAPDRKWDLSRLKFLMNAGEQVTLPVVSDFLKMTAPFGVREQAMQPAFGMAEVCTCMTYTNDYSPKTAALRFKKSSLTGLLEPTGENDPAAVTFIDLGPPVTGIEIRITDNENKLVPEGVIGRFQIRGASVTPGYLKNPPANADAFVGDGWFNSGDIGFILNGRLTLTGREKEIIIIRGANFYCYEIEDVVNSVDGVEPTFTGSCAVADPNSGTEGLAIFFVPKRLPSEMNPSEDPAWAELVQLVRTVRVKVAANLGISPMVVLPLTKKTFPKTTSGKIQRSQLKKSFEAGEFEALHHALTSKSGAATKPARDEVEMKTLAIWEGVLATEVGIETNFFDAGGDSLKATQIISRVREGFSVDLPLSSLFESAATVEGMANLIRDGGGSKDQAAKILKAPADAAIPLTPAQERIWMLEQMTSGPAVYNVGAVVRLRGPLDQEALRTALEQMTERHTVLRTKYEWKEQGIVQTVLPKATLRLAFENATDIERQDRESHVLRRTKAEALEFFDLATAPLWKCRVFQTAADEHYIGLVFHQTITDVWSLQNFVRDLGANYAGVVAGKAPALRPLTIHFSDYAWTARQPEADAAQAETLAYWKEQLANPPGIFQVAEPDFPRGPKQTFAAAIIPMPLDVALAGAVRQLARSRGATYFMGIMAAYTAFLRARTGQEDILLGSALAGRSNVETEPLLGFFVNTVVVRARFGKDETFAGALGRIKQQILGAHKRQNLPFEKVLEELKPERHPNRTPLYQAWLSAWDPLPEVTAGPLALEPVTLWTSGAQNDLSVFVKDCEREPTLFWEYNSDLFKPETVRELMDAFLAFLKQIVNTPDQPLPSSVKGDAPAGSGGSSDAGTPRLGQVRRKKVGVALEQC